MLKIKSIKFATSVNIGHSEEMFLSERKPVDIYFDQAQDRYLLIDQKTKRQVWVHTTNVQWCEPDPLWVHTSNAQAGDAIVPRGRIPDEPKHDDEVVPRGTTLEPTEPLNLKHNDEIVPRGTNSEQPSEPPLLAPPPPTTPTPPEINATQDHAHTHSAKGASPKGGRRAGPPKGHKKTHLR